MFEEYFQSRFVIRRLHRNVLAVALAALVDYLKQRGYAAHGIRAYVVAAEHFGRWMERTGRTAAEFTAQTIRIFFEDHLPRCRCAKPRSRTINTLRPALRNLLRVTQAADTGSRAPSLTPIDATVAAFRAHLEATCGLAPITRQYVGRHVRDLLTARFGEGTLDLAALTAADMAAFVSTRATCLIPASLNQVVNSLRSFQRYLQFLGIGCGERALGALHRAAVWRLASVPKVLTEVELAAFLAAFDRKTAMGRRDYAAALCFSELGLRVGEVARLTLDDIDWRAGLLTLAPGKSRRTSQLPLPAAVAVAVAAYLRDGRPVTKSRTIFVHHRAPLGQPLGQAAVRGIVHRASDRAGLGTRLGSGTRVLRHTAATRMLSAGVPLKEIADVLRHRCLDTSAIYAKVDLAALAAVALPWPQVQP